MRAKQTIMGVLASAAALTMLSACDTSPTAASVNGQVISVASLKSELNQWASSTVYVTDYNAAAAQQNYRQVHGAGVSYSTDWTASRLQGMIVGLAISEHLASTGQKPTVAQQQAAWSANSSYYGPAWDQFPSSLRNTLVQRDAEHAVIEKVDDLPDDAAFYAQHKDAFWSQVCVRRIDVVGGQNATPGNTAADQAAQIQSTINNGYGSSITGGTQVCLSPEQLDESPSWYRDAVLATQVGKASKPVTQPWGDAVINVLSRTTIPFNTTTAISIEVVQKDAQVIPDSAADTILHAAHIQITPSYGTWTVEQGFPFVLPPDKQSSAATSGS